MNSTDRFEFRLIREDQTRLHQMVRSLDTRIELLGRSLEAPAFTPTATESAAVSPPPANPPPRPLAAAPPPEPPPLPSPRTEKPRPASDPRLAFLPVPAAPQLPAKPAPAEPLELRVGTYWMSRIGIVILLTGLVFLGNYAYHRIVPLLGAWGKLSLLALAGVTLGGVGAWLARSRESMRNYGRVLLAGGAATIYYTAYAAHYVEALRVIESPVLGGGLLLALAGGFIGWADRQRSEAIAAPAVLLAYYTSAINPIGSFTLFSNLLLTAAAVFFLVRHSWMRLSYLSLAATYGSYAFWRFHQVAETGAGSDFGMGVTFLAGYWVLFTVAVFLAAPKLMRGSERLAFLTVNNGAFFAFAAQHFAAHRPDAFWMFAVGYGALLLGLAALAARLRSEERTLDGAYLAQGLALVTLGLAAKLTGPQLAVVLAVESVTLLTASRRRHTLLFEIAAGICAVGACSLALVELSSHAAPPVAFGGPIAALLLFNAWWAKRLRGEMERFSSFAFGFAALGLALITVVIWQTTNSGWQPAAFAIAACVSLVALRGRLPEIAIPGQALLGLAVGLFIFRHFEVPPVPWWSPLPVVLAALGLMHWWQRQRTAALDGEQCAWLQHAFAIAAVVTGICWMRTFFTGDAWLMATSCAALGTLLYGFITGASALAVVGQLFTALSVYGFAKGLVLGHPAWPAALAPILNTALAGFLIARRGASHSAELAVGLERADVTRIYRVATLAMVGAWGFEYVGASWRVAYYAALGSGFLALGEVTRRKERAVCGAAYAALAVVLFWYQSPHHALWRDLAAILILPAGLRISRWGTGNEPLFPAIRDGIVFAAMASLWLWVTRWSYVQGGPGQLTTAWAVLALVIFAAGLGLRERLYRLGGFAVLALAVGRLFIVDVWRFDTLPRIVSFLVLGVVLLALSFIYNRFAETMRRWL